MEFLVCRAAARQQQHGHLTLPPCGGRHLDARQRGHRQVGHDQVEARGVGRKCGKRLARIHEHHGRDARLLEGAAHEPADGRLVVQHQHLETATAHGRRRLGTWQRRHRRARARLALSARREHQVEAGVAGPARHQHVRALAMQQARHHREPEPRALA
jgi:hypothetical protein